MLAGLWNRMTWMRSRQVADVRLLSAWVPDSREADAAYAVSLVFEADHVSVVLRDERGVQRVRSAFRTIGPGRLLVRDCDQLHGFDYGTPWRADARLLADGALLYNGRRYVRAADPDVRPWPPELGLGPAHGVGHYPT